MNTPSQDVVAESSSAGKLSVLRAGSKQQTILGKKGDDLRIDWGYVYVAAPTATSLSQQVVSQDEAAAAVTTGKASGVKEGKQLVLSNKAALGKVGAEQKEQLFLIGYDDIQSIQYFEKNLPPWWKNDASGQLKNN